MEKDIIGKLSAKDHKYACALADKNIAESMDTDEWYGCFVILHGCLTIPIRL